MQKGQLLEAILEQKKAVHKDQRRDVPTSRRPDIATLSQHTKKSTSGNVATLQCRDVSASYSSQSLKGKWEQNSIRGSEIGNSTNQGAEIRASVTSISKKSP